MDEDTMTTTVATTSTVDTQAAAVAAAKLVTDAQAVKDAATQAAADKEAQSKAEKSAYYYSRHPEEFALVTAKFKEVAGEPASTPVQQAGDSAVLTQLQELQRTIALKDALLENELTKDDAKFVKGTTPAEIAESAKQFAEYKKSLQGSVESASSTVQDIPKFHKPTKTQAQEAEDWLKNNSGKKIL
jgi:hypothetical protein